MEVSSVEPPDSHSNDNRIKKSRAEMVREIGEVGEYPLRDDLQDLDADGLVPCCPVPAASVNSFFFFCCFTIKWRTE
jgi:hypothetical protein